MKSKQEEQSELCLDVRLVPTLQVAIDRWLAVRTEYKKQASDENLHAYNAAYFALGEAWVERHPDAVDVPGGFERFQSRLISPEEG
jgi:hypothetical protein